MDLSSFLGNDEVKRALSAAFAAGRFPHALVLLGESGCGKRTLARRIAAALVCRNREKAPCGVCPSCIRAAAGSHPDIRIVEGSGVTHSLSVDTVKEITEDAYRRPEEADFSVYILLMGTHTSEAAQNKLLKVIEEPPEGAVFLLVCDSAELLLPTIRSRVQSFTLKPPSQEEAAAFVCEKAGLDEAEARRLADLCGGNIGRMLAEAEGGGAARAQEIAAAMAEGILASSGDSLLRASAPLQKDRQLCGEVLTRLAVLMRDAVVLRSGGTSLLGGAQRAAELLGSLPMRRLCALPDLVEEYRQKAERNANLSLLVTALCARLRER